MKYLVAKRENKQVTYLCFLGKQGGLKYTENQDEAYAYESRNRAHDILVKVGKSKNQSGTHFIMEVEDD